jgi:asparagine synthase (glutamine-hydrolysing)
MCGISGIVQLSDGAGVEESGLRETIGAMNAALAHRGPDGEGLFIKRPVALGHRRLSIIDLSDNGAQPMFNEDGSVVIVFNGEIYNYLELTNDLKQKGHVFRSLCDTEAIIHSYEEYGIDCVQRFNGMWAFVIYDFKRSLMFASRDRLGVKPLYYRLEPDAFAFASEIQALLRYQPSSEANLGKVYDYLAYGYKTHNGETFFQGILELRAAHNLIIEDGRARISRYWDLPQAGEAAHTPLSFEAAKEEFQALLTDAVKLRFRSDVPVAILLSGGLDSTSITRIVDDLAAAGALPDDRITAFSAVFPGYALDESARVREFIKTCRHISLNEIRPDSQGLLRSVESLTRGFGEPVFSTTMFAHHEIMRHVHAAGIKVVINGQGSDEAFCGYDRFVVGYALLDVLMSRRGRVVSEARAIAAKLGYSWKYIAGQVFKALISRRWASFLRAKYQEGSIGCLDAGFVQEHYKYLRNDPKEILSSRNLSNYLSHNIRDYHFGQILHYEDHSSMQHSIEIRSPFIDYRLMEFAFGLPNDFKFADGVTKRVVRESFADRLPASIARNPQKIGFDAPFQSWLKDRSFNAFVHDIVGSMSFRSKRIWNAGRIREKFDHIEANGSFPFWRVLNLELWSRAYGITNL